MPRPIIRPEDWEKLVLENENRLYRAALCILGDRQEAEDAVQDAFLKYLEKGGGVDKPEAWLMRVLVNGCKSRLRLAWRRVVPLPDDLPYTDGETKEELAELYSLPPDERAAVHLFYYEGYSTEEIAAMTSCRPGTVRSRLSRARAKLKKLLDESKEI